MSKDLDSQVKATFDQIVAVTPEIGPAPWPESRRVTNRSIRGVWLAVAASVAALGVAGLAWAATAHDGSSRPASIPTTPSAPMVAAPPATESTESVPPVIPMVTGTTTTSVPLGSDAASVRRGGPTLFPMLDSAVVSGAPMTAWLDYSGESVQPQTNAVVARIDEDGSTSDFYTFVAGLGVSGYADGVGVSTDASVPEFTDVMGMGYAAWTVDGVPVLVMAPDPAVLLDDPAFSMTVGSDENDEATLDFRSLPPGFELLVEPLRFPGEAATARLLIGSPSDADAFVGGVIASLYNPLTNLNLTEGSTISPSQVGDSDAWIVSFPEGDNRTVVWSPDGTTWVEVNWTGPQDDLLTLASAVTVTDDVGEWMTRYDVDLPPVEVDDRDPAG